MAVESSAIQRGTTLIIDSVRIRACAEKERYQFVVALQHHHIS